MFAEAPASKKARCEKQSTGSHQRDKDREEEIEIRWQMIGNCFGEVKMDNYESILHAFGVQGKSSKDISQLLKCELISAVNSSVLIC